MIIAEKPDVALKIAANGRAVLGDFKLGSTLLTKDYLTNHTEACKSALRKCGYLENNGYVIGFAKGHLIRLAQAYEYNPDYKNWRNIPFAFIPDKFIYKPEESTKQVLDTLLALIKRKDIDRIINALDGDREGENIFRFIYHYSGSKKPVSRIWLATHTSEKTCEALKNAKPMSDYDNLGAAGKARTESDFILGALGTTFATRYLSKDGSLQSIGRVQTAVLAEIVRIELLNREFKSIKFYTIKATLKAPDGTLFDAEYPERFENTASAEKVIEELRKETTAVVSFYKETKENKYCPSLHNQTSLGIEMARLYNIDPDRTLEAAQALYDKGYTTYPRTVSRYITKSDGQDFQDGLKALAKINKFANCKFNSSDKRIVNDAEVDGHTAIIATSYLPDFNKLTENEKKVYTEITNRMIAINYPPAVDKKQEMHINIGKYEFNASGNSEISAGWREVYAIQPKDNSIPALPEKTVVGVHGLSIAEGNTKPPKRHTKDSILSFMETCGKKIEDEKTRDLMKNKGIGTNATRPAIFKILMDRQYIECKGKTVYPTDKGIDLIQNLPVDELKSPEFTGNLEYKLYLVEKGQISAQEYMNDIYALYKLACEKMKNSAVQKTVGPVNQNESLGKCPCCGSDIVKKKGKYGEFYSCSGYTAGCKFSISKVCGKLPSVAQVKKLLKTGKTDEIKGMKKKDGTPLQNTYLAIEDKEVKLKFLKK